MTVGYLSFGSGNALAEGHPYFTRGPQDHDNTAEVANLLHRMEMGQPFASAELPRTLVHTGQGATR